MFSYISAQSLVRREKTKQKAQQSQLSLIII